MSAGFHRACAQVQRLVEPTEEQAGASQRSSGPAANALVSFLSGLCDKLFAFSESVDRPTHLTPNWARIQAEDATAFLSKTITFPVVRPRRIARSWTGLASSLP
jgi:hypothetical protein